MSRRDTRARIQLELDCAGAKPVQTQWLSTDVTPGVDHRKQNALHFAVDECHDSTLIQRLCRAMKQHVNDQDVEGNTPLHLAAYRNKGDFVEILIENGALLDVANHRGETAMHHAANECYTGALEPLIKAGCNLHARNEYGNTPLHVANTKELDQLIARGIITEEAQHACDPYRLLVAAGADINALNNHQCTPLHLAAMDGDHHGVAVLLELGADLELKDCDGATALEEAADDRCRELLARAKARLHKERLSEIAVTRCPGFDSVADVDEIQVQQSRSRRM